MNVTEMTNFDLQWMIQAYLSGNEVLLENNELYYKGMKVGNCNDAGQGEASIQLILPHVVQIRAKLQSNEVILVDSKPSFRLNYYPQLTRPQIQPIQPVQPVQPIQPIQSGAEDIREFRSVLDLGLGSTDLPELETPDCIITTLLPHQKQALTFLYKIETNPSPGFKSSAILADDMGLGKTLTMLALIAKSQHSIDTTSKMLALPDLSWYEAQSKLEPIYCKTTLIVVPKSLVANWTNQIDRHCPELTYMVYHTNRKYHISSLQLSDIVITTNGQLVSEFKNGFSLQPPEFETYDFTETKSTIYQLHFYRIIVDEAHKAINASTKLNLAISMLSSHRRFAVTATPLVNRIDDLFGISRILRINELSNKNEWKAFINSRQSLKPFLSQFCLRRTKKTKINGRIIIDLPEKVEHDITFTLTTEEKQVYESIRQQTITDFNNLMDSNRVITIMGLFTLLLRQRQFCLHPNLGFKSSLLQLKKTALKNTKCMECDGFNGLLVTQCQHVFCESCLDFLADSQFRDTSPCPRCDYQLTIDQVFDREVTIHESDLFEEKIKQEPSENGKIKFIVEKLQEFHNSSPPLKSIIFCEFTQFFDILIPILTLHKYKFLLLTGQTQDRDQLLKDFDNIDLGYTILLASLKVGGLGLNLCCACRCFIVNPSWNTVNEIQAIDRIYRLGQTKEVHAYRLITEDSVERMIQEIQKNKLSMFKDALTGQHTRFNLQELKDIIFGRYRSERPM